jgi:hypothetical protein
MEISMATKNARIHIALEQSVVKLLARLAEKDKKTIGVFTRELILEALERRKELTPVATAKNT